MEFNSIFELSIFIVEFLILISLYSLILKRYNKENLLLKIFMLYMILTFFVGRIFIFSSKHLVANENVIWNNVLFPVTNIFFIGILSCFIGIIFSYKLVFFKNKYIIHIDLKKTSLLSILFSIFGIFFIIFVFYKIKVIPLLSENPLIAKYFSNVTEIYVKYRPIYNLGLKILYFSTFFLLLLLYDLKNKKKYIFLKSTILIFFILNIAVLLLTMKRGYILKPFLILIGSLLITKKITLKKFFLLIFYLMLIGVLLWFVKDKELSIQLKLHDLLYGFSNNLFVELREFSRIYLQSKKEVMLMGKTFLSGLLSLIPTSLLEFKKKYYLGRCTMLLLGVNPDIAGAPRISIFGELFLNFREIGVVIFSFLYGFFIRMFINLLNKLNSNAILFFGIFFNVYLMLTIGFFTSGSPFFQDFEIFFIYLLPYVIWCVRIYRRKFI